MFTLHPAPASIVLLSILAFFIIVQLTYHINVFGRFIRKFEHDTAEYKWQGVSIVIAARSEYENLQRLVPALLAQNYPNFEIIIVDDASWDGTTGLLETLEKEHPQIKGIYVTDEMKRNYQGKKLALSLGIKAAKHDIILLTDADCLPQSEFWIQHMVRPFHRNNGTEIVLGYSPFNKQSGMINIVSRMDNLYTGLSYFSYALGMDPYMGVGRNLAYTRQLFFKHKGFASHLHIASGDDDLFVQDAATPNNTAICIHPDSFMLTQAKSSFGDWFRQKKRHNFVGKYYKFPHRMKLGLFALTHGLLWLSFIANIFIIESFGWAWVLIGLYWLVKWPIVHSAFKRLRQAGMSVWIPIFDILYVGYNAVFGMIALFGKQKKW